MAQEPPWDQLHGLLRPEQEKFELEPFEEQFVFPNPSLPSWPQPATTLSTTGYGESVPDGYCAGRVDSTPFIVIAPAFESPHQGGFSIQPNPTSGILWPPTGANRQSRLSLSTWAPPFTSHVSNTSSLLGPDSFVPCQAVAFGQRPPVLPSSPGFRSAANQATTYPSQGNSQAASRSTPGHCSFIFRHLPHLPHLRRSTPQSIEACWKCKSSHTKCDDGTPCGRCRIFSGNSAIPCLRGQVSDTAAEVPFLCHLSLGAKLLQTPGQLPLGLQPAAELLRQARQRRRERIASETKEGRDVQNNDIFSRVVNIKVPNITLFNPFAELCVVTPLELPYDELIINIVWELKDNPEVSHLADIGAVEDLVGLLEAACLCESQFGHHSDRKRRLVYSSMHILLHCMEALRLSARNLLTANAHEYCDSQTSECICPAFHGLTRFAPRYAEALTMAMFHKNKGKCSNWLLVFYSLCIQRHIRCALMSLEQRLQSADFTAARLEVVDFAPPLCSANYLQNAVSLFQQISMQNNGKLAKKVDNSQARPSIYLQQPLRPSSIRAGRTSSSWQKWHEEGCSEYLGRIFQIYLPSNAEPIGTGADTDSDVTMSYSPPTRPAISPAATGVNNGACDYAPSITDSTWSATSRGGSNRWTVDEGFPTPSTVSFDGSLTPSMLSLSTMILDDNPFNYDEKFDYSFGS